MKLTHFALKRPVTIAMIFLSFAVVGGLSSQKLPLELMPNTELPFVYIYIPYFRSTPEQVEKQVTKPVEEIIALVGGIKNIESSSSESGAEIFVEFKWGVNSTMKAIEIREKLENIKQDLPRDTGRIFLGKWSMADIPILELSISSKTNVNHMYHAFNKILKQRLKRIDGVSKVDLYGVNKKKARINLQANKIKAYKINLALLADMLDKVNFSMSAGTIKDGQRQFLLRPIGKLTNLEELNESIIGDYNLRLKDVATLTYEVAKVEQKRRLNGKDAIAVDIYKESGANIVEVTQKVQKELKRIKHLPAMEGIEFLPIYNSADAIKSSLNELLKSGIIGLLLAIVVLFLFLRQIVPTLIVAASIPLSLFFTLACMYFLGYSLNILTMLGLLLAVGMIVDNSVVIVENIQRHLSSETDRVSAIELASDQVSLAIAAGTLTTIIVFLPNMVGKSSEITYYLKHIGMTFSIALCSSLLTAQTVIPMLTMVIRLGKAGKQVPWIESLAFRYRRALSWMLDHPKTTVLLSILLLASMVIPAKIVKTDLMSDGENRILQLQYNISNPYPLKKVEHSVSRIEQYLLTHQDEFEINSVYSDYSRLHAVTTLQLKKGPDANKSQKQIQLLIKKGLPDVVVGKPGFSERKAGGNDKKLHIVLKGPAYQQLADVSRKVIRKLKSIEGLGDLTTDRKADENNLLITLDKEKIRKFKLIPEAIAEHVSLAMRGYNIKSITTSEEEVEVEVMFDEKDRQGFGNLQNLRFENEEGVQFTLDSLASLKEGKGPTSIYRKNRRISLLLYINRGLMTMDDIKETVSKKMVEMDLPSGISWEFGDSMKKEDETESILIFNVALAIVLIFLVMASLFESVLFPWAIWLSISYSIVGVFWFFLVTKTIFTFMAWIGVLVLTGVVVNNGIVLIDSINQLRDKGLEKREALIQAGGDRMRPILMTAATTILGLIPLCISTSLVGGDGPPYYPMARAIVGGLLLSTFVTLIILPTIYNLIDNFSEWLRKKVSTSLVSGIRLRSH